MPYLEIISGQSEVCQTKRYVKIILYVNIIRYEPINLQLQAKVNFFWDIKSHTELTGKYMCFWRLE